MNRFSLANARSICLGLLVGAVACTTDEVPPADTSAASVTPTTATWSSPVDNIPAATITGDLGDPAKWPELPAQARRHCKGTPECVRTSAPNKVWVRVWAAAGANNVRARDVATNTAVMIGKIQNLGTDSADVYNLGPNQVYAVYAMKGATGNGHYEIWGVQGGVKKKAAEGTLTECGHPTRHRTRSFAVFATCSSSPENFSEVTKSDSVLTWANVGTATTHRDGPAWFTCSSGCCTADVQ